MAREFDVVCTVPSAECADECTQSAHRASQLGGLSAITEVISKRTE